MVDITAEYMEHIKSWHCKLFHLSVPFPPQGGGPVALACWESGWIGKGMLRHQRFDRTLIIRVSISLVVVPVDMPFSALKLPFLCHPTHRAAEILRMGHEETGPSTGGYALHSS
jgi:hypothetical protein